MPLAKAEAYGAAAVEAVRESASDVDISDVLGMHALAALVVCDKAAALVRAHEAVERARMAGMPTLVCQQAAIAAGALATDAPAIAVRLWSAAEAERTRRGVVNDGIVADELAPRIAALEQTLGADAFAHERAAGETLTLDQAAALALAATARLARAAQDELTTEVLQS